MELKHIETSCCRERAPNRWHNNAEGFVTLRNIYNIGKKNKKLILLLDKTNYISFNIFVLLKLCVDRLAVYFNTRVVYEVANDTIIDDINFLLSFTENYGEKDIRRFCNNYSYSDLYLFKRDLEEILNAEEILNVLNNEENLKSCLRLNLSELFINAGEHSGNREYNDYGVYFGISISDTKTRVVMANNGDFFSKGIIESFNISYEFEYDYIRKCLEFGFSRKKKNGNGLGLYIIKRFAEVFSAKLLIVSGRGVFCNIYSTEKYLDSYRINTSDKSTDLDSSLPGNVVYIEIENTFFTVDSKKFLQNVNYLDQILIKDGDE